MKKLINDPENVVREELSGIARAHGDLVEVRIDPHYIVRKDAPVQGKVALVSGGGSGHEPLHGGFVGKGMLDAACPGEIFTSPVPDQMLAATKAVDGGAGVVHVVKNYTGDVMNFKLAAEMAQDEGIQVESVLTNDDVAVEDSLYTAGRRGVGITVLLEKIAGAKAEAGGSLAEVASVARKVNDQGRSFGVAQCHAICNSDTRCGDGAERGRYQRGARHFTRANRAESRCNPLHGRPGPARFAGARRKRAV